MREKLAAQFPGRNRWDLKFAPGGLVDIEFIAQTLELVTATRADVLDTNTIEALRKLKAAGALPAHQAAILIETASLEHALTQVLRIALEGTLEPADATRGLRTLLVRASGVEDFDALEARLADRQAAVRTILTATLA
jgi:glutamate-ammonia-ligase adenylyltransferase